MTFNSAIEALRHVLSEGGRVTKTPAEVTNYSDGLYYFVEVTSRKGTVYVLDAVGSEAIELERVIQTKPVRGLSTVSTKGIRAL